MRIVASTNSGVCSSTTYLPYIQTPAELGGGFRGDVTRTRGNEDEPDRRPRVDRCFRLLRRVIPQTLTITNAAPGGGRRIGGFHRVFADRRKA